MLVCLGNGLDTMDLVTFCLDALNHEIDFQEPIVIGVKLIKASALGL